MAKRVKKPMPLHKMTDRAKRNDNMRYQIIPTSPDVAGQTLELDGKPLPYGRSGAFMTDDVGVANAIKDKYDGYGMGKIDVWDVKSQWHPSDKGHRYTFGNVDISYKHNNPNYDEYGKRIDVIIEQMSEKESEVCIETNTEK
jgi:hypothetical protein